MIMLQVLIMIIYVLTMGFIIFGGIYMLLY